MHFYFRSNRDLALNSKPILAQRFAEATRVEDMLPPTIVWANDNFCTLVKTPLVRSSLGRLLFTA